MPFDVSRVSCEFLQICPVPEHIPTQYIASECAREQGKFEEIHRILYSRQKAQDKEELKKYAREIKVKYPVKFDECLDNEKYRGLVEQDICPVQLVHGISRYRGTRRI